LTGLRDRRVVISGGTSGIGAAAARALVSEGVRVWVLGRRSERVQQAISELGVAGGDVCDVSDEEAVIRTLARAADGLGGGLDGAFVNAGIDGESKPALGLSAEHFRRVLDVNVLGAFLVAREAARAMGEGSAIVFNASVNGLRPERGFTDYNASKAAAISIAQTMALELAERGIAVSAICPGYIPTPMTQPYIEDPAAKAEILAEIPAGRLGQPEEVAALVTFLLSPAAAYMTGAVVSVDGGRSV
jgi:NAD(P)-dependent dehydrogenase (short-subunit alcohol dehydrogenase family)